MRLLKCRIKNEIVLQICKNLALAGIGALTLVDDSSCRDNLVNNFLACPRTTEKLDPLEACVNSLRDINPMVDISHHVCNPSSFISLENVEGSSLLILVGQSADAVNAADEICLKAGIPLIATCSSGFSGWAFANLHEHNYVVEIEEELKDGTYKKTSEKRALCSSSYTETNNFMLSLKARRKSPILPALNVVWRFEMEQGRPSNEKDVAVLQEALKGLVTAKDAAADSSLASLVQRKQDMPAINAILGGIVANDAVKVVTCKGEPAINQLFLYSLFDGAGWVEKASNS